MLLKSLFCKEAIRKGCGTGEWQKELEGKHALAISLYLCLLALKPWDAAWRLGGRKWGTAQGTSLFAPTETCSPGNAFGGASLGTQASLLEEDCLFLETPAHPLRLVSLWHLLVMHGAAKCQLSAAGTISCTYFGWQACIVLGGRPALLFLLLF